MNQDESNWASSLMQIDQEGGWMMCNRRFIKAILCILIACLLFPPGWLPVPSKVQAAGENLIQNSSFEEFASDSQSGWTTRRANHWGIWVDSASTPVAPVVTVELYHANPGAGSRSVKVSSPAPNKSRLTVNQGNIPVVPGQEYRLSGAFKTQQITGDSAAFGVNIRVVYLNSAGQALQTDYLLPSNKPVRGNVTVWASYATSTTAPPGAITARIDLDYNQVTGNAWFDDIQFKPWISLKGLSFGEQGGMITVGGSLAAPIQLSPSNTIDRSLIWSTSNPGAATVNESGVISGIVNNSGFEAINAGSGNGFTDKQAPGWTASAPYGSPIITVDEAVYGAGARSLGISAAVNSKASAVQRNIPVISGQWYRLSGLIKTESLTGIGASIRMNWNGPGGTVIGLVYGPNSALKGTHDWQRVEGLFQAPAGSILASLYAYYDTGLGKAWFDDLQLTPWVPVTGLTEGGASFRALNPGESVTLSVYTTPSTATDKRVYWTSSQPQIASVDLSGQVIAQAIGKTIITAASAEGGWSKTYTVYVTSAFPNGGFETVVSSVNDWLNASKPGSWNYYFSNDTSLAKSQLSLDSTVKKEGANSIKIHTAINGKAVLFNKIAGVGPGMSYRVSGWFKQVNGEDNVSLRLLYQDAAGNILQKNSKNYETVPFMGTIDANGWKYYESIITTPAERQGDDRPISVRAPCPRQEIQR
ncbi:tRNA(Glu)-specific nuclease WapA precursor [compost metagenome]